ncbi:uncharacterized protein LOC128341900 isoform X2 [Hemicordylus capensis]|uniref:uncharacterized protein LOC128341900 isoform X2 n=1 Tax=Hemicordylus capensis TaxID=884348 RepID=UPI0023045F05|nr:uncharacterized protein LOC128341900 isoform X2 [Hemicordylus capensis]
MLGLPLFFLTVPSVFLMSSKSRTILQTGAHLGNCGTWTAPTVSPPAVSPPPTVNRPSHHPSDANMVALIMGGRGTACGTVAGQVWVAVGGPPQPFGGPLDLGGHRPEPQGLEKSHSHGCVRERTTCSKMAPTPLTLWFFRDRKRNQQACFLPDTGQVQQKGLQQNTLADMVRKTSQSRPIETKKEMLPARKGGALQSHVDPTFGQEEGLTFYASKC